MKQPFLLLAAIATVGADDYNHRYKEGEKVDLWVNKVRRQKRASKLCKIWCILCRD